MIPSAPISMAETRIRSDAKSTDRYLWTCIVHLPWILTFSRRYHIFLTVIFFSVDLVFEVSSSTRFCSMMIHFALTTPNRDSSGGLTRRPD
uniref:Uncharacterized protein n=1 Tax=Kalanchoe fedtschenkoi TaxID=63787 RepID=A0A7N0UAV5_KALFE